MKLTVTRRDGSEHAVLFDDPDANAVLARTWHIRVDPKTPDLLYARTMIRNLDGSETTLTMHQLLMGELGTDHINHDGLDNRRANLRPATPHQQQGNRRPQPGYSSRYKGVHWKPSRDRWRAEISVGNRSRTLGSFRSEDDAAHAYDQAALAVWGEFALLNFPPE
jgi:hypothetical protein